MRFLTTISPTNHPSWNRIFEETYNIYIYTHLQQGPFLYCPLTLITNSENYPKVIGKILQKVQGCRFVPESSRQTLVSPIFRSLRNPSVAACFRGVKFLAAKSHKTLMPRWQDGTGNTKDSEDSKGINQSCLAGWFVGNENYLLGKLT